MEEREGLTSLIELLGLVPSGKATVSVAGRPLVTIDADKKTLDLEAGLAGAAGLRLSDLMKLEEGPGGAIEGSLRLPGALAHLGWRLTVYSEGDTILTMGSGVSRLTGRISMNPLRLRKLLKALK